MLKNKRFSLKIDFLCDSMTKEDLKKEIDALLSKELENYAYIIGHKITN